MMTQIQQEILRLKKEQDVCILAHSYQTHDILEIADFAGDSFQLSVKAQTAPQQNLLLCGVRFMAEGAKLLSPHKKVVLANPGAGCPMAEQFSPEEVAAFKGENPDYTVVAYVNTTAALKTVCDVCVTSSSAIEIVRKIESDKILFIPDCNLGQFVANAVPEKEILLWQGGCPIHAMVQESEAIAAKAAHPNAKLLVHPECIPAVTAQADFAGSTSAIMDYIRQSPETEFIIGTELSIAAHMQYQCPDKRFYPLSKKLYCPDMKLTTLMDVYQCLLGTAGEEILLDDNMLEQARVCIDEMLRLG